MGFATRLAVPPMGIQCWPSLIFEQCPSIKPAVDKLSEPYQLALAGTTRARAIRRCDSIGVCWRWDDSGQKIDDVHVPAGGGSGNAGTSSRVGACPSPHLPYQVKCAAVEDAGTVRQARRSSP